MLLQKRNQTARGQQRLHLQPATAARCDSILRAATLTRPAQQIDLDDITCGNTVDVALDHRQAVVDGIAEELPADDGATIAATPIRCMICTACSRDELMPKLLPATMTSPVL